MGTECFTGIPGTVPPAMEHPAEIQHLPRVSSTRSGARNSLPANVPNRMRKSGSSGNGAENFERLSGLKENTGEVLDFRGVFQCRRSCTESR